MKKLRILLCLLMFYCFEAKSRELNAVQEILWDGQIIGYQTQDSNVDFISPFYWKIVSEKTFIEMKSEHEYFLNILFKPDYSSANNYILNQKISNPNKIFLPLPWRLEKAELHLIDLLGSVEIQLTPSLLNQSPYIYFKVLLSESQLETIKKLAQSEVPIVGSSEYSFVRRDEVIHSSAAINGKLSPEFFKNSKSKNFGLEWLIDLFRDYQILLHGAIDGYFSLGRVNLSIKNSILNINLDPSKTEFKKEGDTLSLIPSDSNISGKVT